MNGKKLYCYVDESGQDTKGLLFIVSAVIVVDEYQEASLRFCESTERDSKKGTRKWGKSRPEQRYEYMQAILQSPLFQGRLNYAVYHQTKEYLELTSQTIAQAIHAQPEPPDKVTVLIDGLQDAHVHTIGTYLYRSGISVRKVRGIQREENDALCRLADALCGLVRAAVEEVENSRISWKTLFEKGKRNGYLIDVR